MGNYLCSTVALITTMKCGGIEDLQNAFSTAYMCSVASSRNRIGIKITTSSFPALSLLM
jgi:hypothetical protein